MEGQKKADLSQAVRDKSAFFTERGVSVNVHPIALSSWLGIQRLWERAY